MTIYVVIKNYYNYENDSDYSEPIKAFTTFKDACNYAKQIAIDISFDPECWDEFDFGEYDRTQIEMDERSESSIYIDRIYGRFKSHAETYLINVSEIELKNTLE